MPNQSSHIVSINTNEVDFIFFFQENYSSFCFFANRYVGDPIVAEDIIGDVALKIWEKKDQLGNVVSFKSYFYTSIRNACINWIRKEKSQAKQEIDYQTTTQANEQTTLENIICTETLRELETAIHSLPAQCRKVFLKLFVEGKTLSETAEEMELSIFTVKAQRQRGIKLLRRQLIGSNLFTWIVLLFL